VRAVASFASSEQGKAFARIEQHFGRDPAASLEELDDVLAHNLRAALLITMAEDVPEEHENEVEKAKTAGARIREQLGA
jgi:hypothetical protein